MRLKEPLPSHFAYCRARTDVFRDFTIQSTVGSSGRQRVPASALDRYLVAIPNPEVAQTFGDCGRAEFERIRAGVNEIFSLAAMRDPPIASLLGSPTNTPTLRWQTQWRLSAGLTTSSMAAY